MENDSMIRVLYIGLYNGEGKFTKEQWKYFLEWCEIECNKIIIYSQMTYSTVCSKFPSSCNIIELEKPDEALNVYAYEISVINVVFWDYIKHYNYNIDIMDNISHMFFFNSERFIASLEIVDYENYLFIEEPITHEEKLLLNKDLIYENIQFCFKGKVDIDELLQEENWKPLGESVI